jgi:hypothetical protein
MQHDWSAMSEMVAIAKIALPSSVMSYVRQIEQVDKKSKNKNHQ